MAINQSQNLNLQPGAQAQTVVHLSQGDHGNTLTFYLYNGSQPFVADGYSVSVHGVRQDRAQFGPIAVATHTGSNEVTITVAESMTAVAGAALAELTLSDGTAVVGTANFAMLVEQAEFPDGPIYSSDLSVYQNILNYVQSGVGTEAAARAAADTTLQNNINAEASARQAADNTLQSNINAEASARASADTNLQAQINQIIAPSGEAPSAAEVENARIGADNVTYPTLGDAIRGQVTDLKKEINDCNVGKTTFGQFADFQPYGLNLDGTYLTTQKYRVSTETHISFDYDITCNVSEGYKWGYIPFTGGMAGSWSGWYNHSRTVTIEKGTEFVVQIALDPETLVTVTDVIPFVNAIIISNYAEGNIEKLKNTVYSYNKAHQYVGERMPNTIFGFDSKQLFRMYYSGMTSQDIDYYGDYMFVSFSGTEEIRVYTVDTPAVIADISVVTNHGSGMQFSDKFYADGDEFPLLYVGGWTDNIINVIRITHDGDTWGAEIVKRLYIPIEDGYYMTPSISGDTLYCIGYTLDSIAYPTVNKMVLASYDLVKTVDNGDGTSTPTKITRTVIPYLGVMQGRKYMNGNIYIAFASSNGADAKILCIDAINGTVKTTLNIAEYLTAELEGLCYRVKGSRIIWYLTTYYYVYELTF